MLWRNPGSPPAKQHTSPAAPGEQQGLRHVGTARHLGQALLAAAGSRHWERSHQGRHMLVQRMRRALNHACVPGNRTIQPDGEKAGELPVGAHVRPAHAARSEPCLHRKRGKLGVTASWQTRTRLAATQRSLRDVSVAVCDINGSSASTACALPAHTAPHLRQRQGPAAWTAAGKPAAARPPH